MTKRIFRQVELIDRVEEIEFFKEWFEGVPKEILWVYGPKSTGKTTLIEYIVENELFDDFKLFKSKKYNVKYINFRQKLFGGYESFLNSMLFVDDGELDKDFVMSLSLGVFKVDYKTHKKIKNKEMDLFDTLFKQFKESPKKNILIIDEIQVLEDIYIDKERELLKEFLNFCVRLTKETHLSHVVILSSNTIFIEKIYNNAKLKVTSRFKKISHLPYEIVKEWLSEKGYSNDDIDLIWEYLGGSIAHIQRVFRDQKEFPTLKEYLDFQAKVAKSEIVMLFLEKKDLHYNHTFKYIAKEIIKNGYYTFKEEDFDKKDVIDFFCEREILFFEPLDNTITANSKIYIKGMELLEGMKDEI